MDTQALPGYSFAEYARHRGCSKQAVSRAAADGRLRQSVDRTAGVPRIRDFGQADREWAANTRTWRIDAVLRDDRLRRRASTLLSEFLEAEELEFSDVVPVERLTVMEMDDAEVSISAASAAGDDRLDQFFALDAAGARWLAGELLRFADKADARTAASVERVNAEASESRVNVGVTDAS